MSSNACSTIKRTRRNFTLTQRPQQANQCSFVSDSAGGFCRPAGERPAIRGAVPAREIQWYPGEPADTALQEHANVPLKDVLPSHRFTANQATANTNSLAFLAYQGAQPPWNPTTPAANAVQRPPPQKPQDISYLRTPLPSTPSSPASSSPIRRASSEISSTTMYDVSAMYMVPLCASNFVLMVGSAVVFLSSLYAEFEPRDSGKHSFTAPSTFLVALLFNLETVLMVVSGLLFLTASVGLLGAVRENVCLLEVYKNVVMCLVVLSFGASLLVAGMPWLAHTFIMDHVTEDFVVHYRDKADYMKTIDYLQTTLSCCGMTQAGYRDWQANVYFACNESNPSPERCSVPPSCCRHTPSHGEAVRRAPGNVLGADAYPPIPSTLCGRGVLRMSDRDAWKVIHLRGCGDAIFQTLRAHNLELFLIMLVLVAYLLLLIALASSVQSQIRSLTWIYDKYYETVYRGQKSMKHAHERCLRNDMARSTGASGANTPLSPAPLVSAADGGMPNGHPSWRQKPARTRYAAP
ncbi:hypothetical protein MTO96_025003 [Rhipicephalus appendiculatus]